METIGFGYLGISICHRCTKPEHVFVHSVADDFVSRCATCWSNVYYGDPVRIPNSESYPIIDSEHERCVGCGYVELPTIPSWKFVKAYLKDSETQVTVHYNCVSDTCEDCDLPYASTRRRDWSAGRPLLSDDLFTQFSRIENSKRCSVCTTKFYEENGGEDSYRYCGNCDDTVHYDNTSTYDGERYCEYCINENVYDCDECGHSVWSGNSHDCRDDESSLIHSYSYRPSPFFFGSGKYHFGFELEVEARQMSRHEGAVTVQNHLGGRAYMKEDGSLNDGFEIVTHPHTLENYQKEFDWSVLVSLKDEGFRSWNTSTCGLHVHVSRTAFGSEDPWSRHMDSNVRSQLILKKQAHELRFMKLVYDNQRQVERIAGRSNNSYATFGDKGKLLRKMKYGEQDNGRYSAINTENDATIEVRVFKGSLRKERVLSALEFVHAAVEYTRDVKVTSKNHALSWLKFTGYVSANADNYPNLVTIMGESFANDESPNENDN